jgi:hypothetical protein
MSSFIERLGLVIHWFGFLVGVFFFLTLMIVGFMSNETGLQGAAPFFSAPVFALIPWGIGWLIRYIAVGKVKSLPWEK